MIDLETRNEVARVLKPIIDRQTETIVSTEKNTKYYNYLEQRVAAMEIVFEQGQGKNFIWDSLMSKLADEVRLKFYLITFNVESGAREEYSPYKQDL